MDKILAERLFQAARDRGADFVELFEEETRNASVVFKDGKVETARAGTEFGIGIRLLFGTEVVYGFTSREEESHLLTLVRRLAESRSQAVAGKPPAALQFSELRFTDIHRIAIDPAAAGQAAKLDLLVRADRAARAVSPLVAQVQANGHDTTTEVLIANSEGLWVRDRRVHTRFGISVTAAEAGDLFTASEAPGEMRGFEFLQNLDVEAVAREAAERAVLMLKAPHIEGGRMPVVMGNAFGGVIFHEACGHPLETEALRVKSSFFAGKLGQPVANPRVTAIDDGTIANAWGSLNVDDEGMPTQRTVLLENGILRNYLSDRVGAQELGLPRTGSGRRESYKYAPVSRMRNTYIAAGSDRFDDMIASVDRGLYAKKMGGGSVNPATGEFNFSVAEGYEIAGGKIGRAVRGASLIGLGHEILFRISMVGDNLELAAGMCGAGSGTIPTTVGQPSLKVDEILVGGRA